MSKVINFPMKESTYDAVYANAKAKIMQDNLRIQNGLEPIYSMRNIVADMLQAAMAGA